jgi:hypothetical protein
MATRGYADKCKLALLSTLFSFKSMNQAHSYSCLLDICTAVSETVGDALKSAAKAFSAGDATGDKAGSVGGKFRSDGEIGKEGEKGESPSSSFLLED